MKKVSILFVAMYFILLILSSGCSRGNRELNDGLALDSIRINEDYYLFGNREMPGCNISIDFIYPSAWNEQEELKKLQSLFIEKSLGDKYTAFAPPEAAKAYKDHYINNFKDLEIDDNYKNYFADEVLEYQDETGYEAYIILKNNTLYNDKGFVSFVVEKTSYDGGAHSSRDIRGYVIDLGAKRFLKRDEFEGAGYGASVAKLMAGKIARDNNLADPKELENIGYTGLEDIAPTDNFTLDDKGITYYFNENDIAGAMVGITSVFIPYNEISIYMTADNPIAGLMR